MYFVPRHLSASLVAAFIKRLSRLSLTAPPTGLIIIVRFIYNLLKRHPNCSVLIHRTDSPGDVTSDPYNHDEPDPYKSDAMKSSLWEVKVSFPRKYQVLSNLACNRIVYRTFFQSLLNHYYLGVTEGLKFMRKMLSGDERPIADLLETTVDDVSDQQNSRRWLISDECRGIRCS